MLTTKIFESALHIQEPWYIKDIQFNLDNKRLDIHVDFYKGAVFHYESEQENINGDYKAYDTQIKQWRHLNFFEYECYLHARVPRVKIDEETIRLISPPWSGLSNGFTMLFEALVLQLAIHMPVHTVSRIINTSDYKIWAMLEKYVNLALSQNDYSQLTSIGIDETSKRKGYDYITLFVDLIQRRTIFIAEGKDHKTLGEFVDDLAAHKGEPEKITDVSCDMSPAFIKGVKEHFPEAKITFDRFHIMKILNKAVDKVRKEEVKVQSLLKGNKYIFLKNKSNLTDKRLKGREELFQAAKAKARGFRNNRYFKIIAFLVTGKLDFTSFNKCYLPT